MKKIEKKGQNIYTQIVIKAPRRTTSDVATWRTALRAADMGRHKQLFDLYEDLLIDGVLADAVSKRVEALTNSELTFVNDKGEEVPEITEIIDTLAFEDLLTTILQSKFWGRSGGEFDFANGFAFNIIPPKHISLETSSILINEVDESGIPYENDDFIFVVGKQRDKGLFLKTAPLAVWKRGGFGDYAQWLEIFGMPQRVGKYSSYDTESRKVLEEALSKAGSAPWVVIPKESEVETVNNTSNGSSGTSYNDFRKACNDEMLITLLGQTLTTTPGDKGARALGEVHRQVEEGKYRSDMRYTQRILNTHVKPILLKRGYPAVGNFVFPKDAEPLSVNDIVSLSKIIRIPVSYLHTKYSIPMPKDNEEVTGPPNTNEPKVKTIKEDEPDGFFVQAPTKTGASKMSSIIESMQNIIKRITATNSMSIDIDKLVKRAIRELYNDTDKQSEIINGNLFNITNTKLQIGVSRELLEVKDEDFIRQFKENTAVFSAFKSHNQTKDIVALLTDENGKLRSFSQFKKLALQISEKYNVQWLQTEYNTAVRAARSAANFLKYKETAHLYPNLEYLLSSASHRRISHERYAGTILPIEHIWWETHMPPSDWNCQCSVRQTDKKPTAVPGEEVIIPAFQNNPGKTAQPLKIEETPYYKNTEESLRGDVKDKALEMLRNMEPTQKKKYEGKNGGYLNIVKQNKNEFKNNVETYKKLADDGKKYSLLEVVKVPGVKNPDAFNETTKMYSDAKHPTAEKGKSAIQNSIQQASKQGVGEIVINLSREYPSHDLYDGIKTSLQKGRAKQLKTIIILMKNRKPIYLNVDQLREKFYKNTKED